MYHDMIKFGALNVLSFNQNLFSLPFVFFLRKWHRVTVQRQFHTTLLIVDQDYEKRTDPSHDVLFGSYVFTQR